MTTAVLRPARVRVRLVSGAVRTFVADECEVSHGLVVASGRWAHNGQRGEYAWSTSRVLELKWVSR